MSEQMGAVKRFGVCTSLILGGCLAACHSSPRSAQSSGEPPNPTQMESSLAEARPENRDNELMKLVNQFASSSIDSEVAWKKIQSYPRQELITSLLRIERSLAADDRQRVLISFALCNLDYDYEKNREIVTSALARKPRYRHFDADGAASLMARLMQRGDNRLLPALFSAAPWSDGAFATELGGYYLEAWRSDPKGFLIGLKSVPIKARRSVYFLLLADELLTTDDSSKMKGYLRSVTRDRSVGQIAREMLRAIPRVEEQLRANQQ